MARKLIVMEQSYYDERNRAMGNVGYTDEQMALILHRPETADEKAIRTSNDQKTRMQLFKMFSDRWSKTYIDQYRASETTLRNEANDRLFLTRANMSQSCIATEDMDKVGGNYLAGALPMKTRAECLMGLSELLGDPPKT